MVPAGSVPMKLPSTVVEALFITTPCWPKRLMAMG
jgi:hypothetical protein